MYILLDPRKPPRIVRSYGEFMRKPRSERVSNRAWLAMKRDEAAAERRIEQLRGHELVLNR